MVLHFLADKKFGKNFIKFVSENYNINEHVFVLVGSQNYDLPSTVNAIQVSKKDIIVKLFTLIKLVEKADSIIVHYLALQELYFFMYFCKRYLKKFKWVMYGGDIYNNSYNKHQIKLIKQFMMSIGAVCYLIEEDYLYVVKRYGVKPRKLPIRYAQFIDPNKYIEILHKEIDCDTQIAPSVIVGNSASFDNQHKLVFSFIPRIKELSVYCPLSYGDNKYANYVTKLGEKKFGSQFIPLVDFLPYEDYLKLLCNIGFGIYGFKRQQGLGNVRILLLMGKKVFLIENSPMYKHFKRYYPKQVFGINEIKNFNVNQLTSMEPIHDDLIRELYDINKIKALWNRILYY